MPKKRLGHIDFLRAVAIIGMIITHVLSYNLGREPINSIWNYLHFVVPIFVYCSGYVIFRRYENTIWNFQTVFGWYKRRTVRLLLPYYAFTVLHYLLWFAVPKVFTGLGLSLSASYVARTLFLVGVDYGWLPLLFIELMTVTPLLLIMMKIQTWRTYATVLSVASAIFLLFARSLTIDYRIIMWIPWSTILLLSFLSASYERSVTALKSILITLTVIALVIFASCYTLLTSTHLPLTLTLHKYPPDIFYLSYGVGIGALLLLIESAKNFQNPVITRALAWISSNSYSLFFIHYIVIDALQTFQHSHGAMNVFVQLFLSIFGTCGAFRLSQEIYKRLLLRQLK